MARIRTIKPDFFKHEGLFDAEMETGLPLRLAFAGIWTICDREGRFEWRPRAIKTDVLPYDEIDFSRVLDALATRGFLVRYRVGSREYGVVPGFSRHQVINPRESASSLPAPDEATENEQDLTREARVDDASATRQHLARGEGKGREGEREGEGEGGGGSACAREPGDQTFLERCCEAAGSPIGMLTPSGKGLGSQADGFTARRWLNDLGLTEDEIVAEITRVAASKQDDPPSTLSFFDRPLARLAGAKSRPALEPIVGGRSPAAPQSGGQNDAAFERALQILNEKEARRAARK